MLRQSVRTAIRSAVKGENRLCANGSHLHKACFISVHLAKAVFCRTAFCTVRLLFLRAVVAVLLLERGDLFDHAEHHIKAVADRFKLKAVGHIAPSMIIIRQNGVLRRKSDGLHASFCHGRAVAAADGVMDAAAGLALDAELLERVLKHFFQVGVKAGELPVVLDDDLEILLIRDGVDVDVPCVFEHFVVLVLLGKRHRTAQARFLRAAVEVDDAAVFRHFVGVFLKIFEHGIA